MNCLTSRVTTALLVLGISVGSCGGAGSLPSDELQRKLLEHQSVKFPQRLFVVSLGSGPTLEAATESAFGELTRQLTWLPAGSQDLLRGMYRVERSATDTAGKVQLLASLERDAASAHLRRLARDAERAASDRLPECRRLLQAGEIGQAEACLTRGNADLARAGDLLAAARAAVGDPARRSSVPGQSEYTELMQQTSAGRTSRRSLLLNVIKEMDGQAAGDLDETFAPVATEAGFRRLDAELGVATASKALGGSPSALLALCRQTGAGYALVGRVRARFSSEDSGQYFAMAGGVLKLLETAGGRTVAELSCDQVKGGHVSRAQALEKAVQNVVKDLLPRLRSKLRELAAGGR